jgi:succinate dehydrogenase / fumarate reductase membrane anchor subunit
MAENAKSTGLRSPLARVRGLGSAHHGAGAWWAMRLTSLALVPLGLWFVVSVVSMAGATIEEMRAWLSGPFSATMMILTLAVTFHHGAAGVREIVEDYVHDKGAKLAAVVAVNFLSAALALWSIVSVLTIAFGG